LGAFVAPLAGWNVRGYSYGERTADGQLHPGADLNVGYGDDDRGLPVVAFAAGTAVYRGEWDGATYGYGNFALVEHVIGADSALTPHAGLRLWSLYAHLDSFDEAFVEGAPVAAGQRIGACGKSGWQEWAHLHFELRYAGPPEMQPGYWGGRLTPEQLSERYADPYTLMKTLGGLPEPSSGGVDPAAYAALQADRDFNWRLKQRFEHELRTLEARRRLKRGTVTRLIATASAS
jgi:murein DD-endopeptidase MepM/ murein hydrolase activator NlpD